MKSAADLTDLYRATGRKMTAQRLSIFDALSDNSAHPSAEMVYEVVRAQIPTISLKTVYQTLNELAEMGEVDILDLGTGTVRFDPNVDDEHHHLVCNSCGAVRDLHIGFDGLALSSSESLGYRVAEVEVVFRGTCASCAGDEAAGLAVHRGHRGD